ADVVVAVGLVEELAEGDGPHLELLLQLGTGPARFGGLGERLLALLWGQRGRLRHGAHPTVRTRRCKTTARQVSASATSAATATAAFAGSGAWVTVRPTTSTDAPAAIAWPGVPTRTWSWRSAPAVRMPGPTATRSRDTAGTTGRAGAAHTPRARPASRASAARRSSSPAGASASLVRTVTPRAIGSGRPAPAAPARRPSTPAESMSSPPWVWKFR